MPQQKIYHGGMSKAERWPIVQITVFQIIGKVGSERLLTQKGCHSVNGTPEQESWARFCIWVQVGGVSLGLGQWLNIVNSSTLEREKYKSLEGSGSLIKQKPDSWSKGLQMWRKNSSSGTQTRQTGES